MVIDLAESRKKIDEIDKEIVRLFQKRMGVATDVAAYKRSTGKKVLDPKREEEKIESLRALGKDEFNKMGIEDLFRQIMSISRKYQYQALGPAVNEIPFRQVKSLDADADTRVVCFGEHGAFTEQAMEDVFGMNISAFHKNTFREVMEMVANGEAKYGVLPIENTSTGGITDIYDLLVDYDVTIVAEHVIKVEQDLLGLPVINIRHVPLTNTFNSMVKRSIDIFGALVAIILFSPIMLISAILVKTTSKGPLIFRQERVGLHNKPFYMYKFRSMAVQEIKDEKAAWTTKNDPRVTGIGKIMRKTSIDELPQFINVLKGDMSLVGTRPPTVNEFKQYQGHHKRRLSMKPGITGMWQAYGRSTVKDFEEIVKMDLDYIDHWSLGLDMKILCRTVVAVFQGG